MTGTWRDRPLRADFEYGRTVDICRVVSKSEDYKTELDVADRGNTSKPNLNESEQFAIRIRLRNTVAGY